MTLPEEKVMDIIKESNISPLSVAYSTRSVKTVSIQRLQDDEVNYYVDTIADVVRAEIGLD